MNISSIIQTISSAIDSVRNVLAPIPGLFLICTCTRRPGFSSIITSAKIYADMNQNENDEIVKKFVMNVVDKIKKNIHDDGVCFVIMPPGSLAFQLIGSNAGGPIVFSETQNLNFVFAWAIIR